MNKPIIAVDIDDVLAASVEGFIAFSNEHYGTRLTVDDYDEHWARMWKVDMAETERRAKDYHTSGLVRTYRAHDTAKDVLMSLQPRFSLVAMTSRQIFLEKDTREWIIQHYAGLFDDIQFAGIFDAPLHDGMLTLTKGELFARNDVRYVIDDQLKHCLAAAELGIETVLFGNYSWNQTDSLPALVTRCNDWPAVQEYFDGRS